MNNFKIVIKEWYTQAEATKGVNNFIAECTERGLEVVEITSHLHELDANFYYVFIFKLSPIK